MPIILDRNDPAIMAVMAANVGLHKTALQTQQQGQDDYAAAFARDQQRLAHMRAQDELAARTGIADRAVDARRTAAPPAGAPVAGGESMMANGARIYGGAPDPAGEQRAQAFAALEAKVLAQRKYGPEMAAADAKAKSTQTGILAQPILDAIDLLEKNGTMTPAEAARARGTARTGGNPLTQPTTGEKEEAAGAAAGRREDAAANDFERRKQLAGEQIQSREKIAAERQKQTTARAAGAGKAGAKDVAFDREKMMYEAELKEHGDKISTLEKIAQTNPGDPAARAQLQAAIDAKSTAAEKYRTFLEAKTKEAQAKQAEDEQVAAGKKVPASAVKAAVARVKEMEANTRATNRDGSFTGFSEQERKQLVEQLLEGQGYDPDGQIDWKK